MRRNLTLEETGVLDLRKFQPSVNEASWNIPIDWLILQGLDSNYADSLDAVANLLKTKFSIFISAGVDNGKYIKVYASTSLNEGSAHEVATYTNGDYIYVDTIEDGYAYLSI